MNRAELEKKLEKKLIAAAQKNSPRDHVPYAFEQRVMAGLKLPREIRLLDPLSWWSRALWIGAGACAAVALVSSVWSFASEESGDGTSSFSQEVEQTLFTAADVANNGENVW